MTPAWISDLIRGIPPNQRLWIFTAGLVVCTGLVGFSGIQSPWQQGRKVLLDRYRQERQRTELLSAIGIQRKYLENQGRALLLQGGASTLMGEVSKLASRMNMKVESIVPQPETSLGSYKRLQVRVAATTSYADLLKFVRALERYGALFKPDQVEVSELSADRQKVVLLISGFSK